MDAFFHFFEKSGAKNFYEMWVLISPFWIWCKGKRYCFFSEVETLRTVLLRTHRRVSFYFEDAHLKKTGEVPSSSPFSKGYTKTKK